MRLEREDFLGDMHTLEIERLIDERNEKYGQFATRIKLQLFGLYTWPIDVYKL